MECYKKSKVNGLVKVSLLTIVMLTGSCMFGCNVRKLDANEKSVSSSPPILERPMYDNTNHNEAGEVISSAGTINPDNLQQNSDPNYCVEVFEDQEADEPEADDQEFGEPGVDEPGAEDQEVDGPGEISKKDNLYSWYGYYIFEEGVPRLAWAYGLWIYDSDGEVYAELSVDGHLMSMRLLATLRGDASRVDVIFKDYYDVGDKVFCEKGDVLFTLVRDGNEVLTYWDGLQPNLEKSMGSGILAFEFYSYLRPPEYGK